MNAARTSTAITTLSASVLAVGGVALLFASDVLLPKLVPGVDVRATVLGQLVAAGWLGVAWLNWNQRRTLLGGIYGRLVMLPNLALYLISGFSLMHAARANGSFLLGAFAALFGILAVLYAALLLRGPFGTAAATDSLRDS